ncbi:MAG: hypothetical protein KGQ59_10010 [Bdellovibrionales bacterium]|nr:hypothetical protein [Bdellovibrionales bacterium]
MKSLKLFWSEWCSFWFDSFSVQKWRLFRSVTCSIMFIAYLIRHFSLETFFSKTNGIYISDPSQYVNMAYRWNLLSEILPSPSAYWILPTLHLLYLLCLLMLIFGFFLRFSAVLAFVLHVSFIHANIGEFTVWI